MHDPISPPKPPRRRFWLFIAGLAFVFAVIIVLESASTNDYALTPGHATQVAPLVTIKGVATNPHPSKIMLVDVYESSLTIWQWITMHFQSHVQIVPADELVEPGVSTSELSAQGFLEMSDAKQAAEVAAFRALGWHVPATPTGAVITAVVDSSPAARAGLAVGDHIGGVNNTEIHSGCQFVSAVHSFVPGTTVTLQLSKVKISASGVLSYRAPSKVHVVTTTVPGGGAASGCPGVSGLDKSFLGIGLENGYQYTLPASVNIDTADIGGPSAGLAMTLTLINQLSHGSLTGGHIVAATGTMAPDGQVGAVGGLEEKAVAAHNAHAQYFIVPDGDGNVDAARAADEPGLTILPVTSLKEALEDLRQLGGAKPVPITKP